MSERIVNAQPNQIFPAGDFTNSQKFVRASIDHLVADAVTDQKAFVSFNVVQTAPAEVTVAPGRFYKGGEVYFRDDVGGVTIDLLSLLPAVTKKVVAIVVWGNAVDTDTQPRTFLIDPVTRQTEARVVSVENRRVAYVDRIPGNENADPQPPQVDSNVIAVAYVTLNTTGIEKIEMVEANRLISTKALHERVVMIEQRLNTTGSQLDTLKTDISALAAALRTKADMLTVSNLAFDMANVKEKVDLPDDYSFWSADHFLDLSETDDDFAGYSALVEEGVRFPLAAEKKVAIDLDNPLENRVSVNDNMALPAFTSQVRLSVRGRDGEHALTSTTIETVQLKQRLEARTRRELLSSEQVCTNEAWWRQGRYDPITRTFTRNGEVFEVVNIGDWIDPYLGYGLTHWVYVRRYREVSYTETYWDRITVQEDVSGSIVAQTFLNSQGGFLTGLNLFFTRRAITGDVRVAICETRNGVPQLDKVLSRTTLTPANLNIYPAATPVTLKPTFLNAGERYAVVIISPGAHFVATVSGNKFAEGTIFYSTDGSFSQGDIHTDLAMETKFAVFNTPVVTVQLEALELAGGIDSISINADAIEPEGTRLDFQIRVGGVWRSIEDGKVEDILAGHPSITQFRVMFLGTTDVMPALGLGETRSEIRLSRPANAFTHVSTIRTMPGGGTATQVELTLRMENWHGASHTLTPAILVGAGYATVETPDVTEDSLDPIDGALIRKCTFNLAAPVSTYRIRLTGTSSSTAIRYHVAGRTDIAFAS